MLRGTLVLPLVLGLLGFGVRALAAESDALAIDATIQARHMPFGIVTDPVFAGPNSNDIVGYTRCGDAALWTGSYLAAESFRYQVTHAAEALGNVRRALAGLQMLVDVTGTDVLARCAFPANSPYAEEIQNEEAGNGIYTNPANGLVWIGHTSRDQYSGVFFGLGVAYDLVDDGAVHASVAALAIRLLDFLIAHGWNVVMPDATVSTSFLVRQDQVLSLLQVGRHINPARYSAAFDQHNALVELSFLVPLALDTASDDSYFKFNLDYINLFNLMRLDTTGNATYRKGYAAIRLHTAWHQNAFFDLIDRAIKGPDAGRDEEAAALLEQWLQRPRRDPYVDLTGRVPVCGAFACEPIPVPWRVPTDFVWQRNPFQLAGGGKGLVETAGIDYVLPYWMARYYGVGAGIIIRSAASGASLVAPGSMASLYGTNLAAGVQQAGGIVLPQTLGGVSVQVRGADGISRNAGLFYVAPGQINLLVPADTPPGLATFAVSGTALQSADATVARVSPALFSMQGNGVGVAAATAVRATPGDASAQVPVPVFACHSGTCAGVPIAVNGGAVFVTLDATGLRNRSTLGNVTVQAGGLVMPALFAGPQPQFAGLDQVNFQLPASLAGCGEIAVSVTAEGQTSNAVSLTIQ